MKTLAILIISCAMLFARVGRQIDTPEYRIAIQDSRDVPAVPLGWMPTPPKVKPSVMVTVFSRNGVMDAKEYRITLRFIGADGKTYRQTLTAAKTQDAVAAVFDVDALDVLSVDVERVNPPIIQEAQ